VDAIVYIIKKSLLELEPYLTYPTPQRLAQLGKELDIRISSAGDINSPSNAVCSAIGSDGKVRGNDILTTALTASGQASLQVPVQEVRAVPPNLESGPRHSIGNGEPAALSDDGVVLDMPSGKEEVPKGQLDEFMTPLQVRTTPLLAVLADVVFNFQFWQLASRQSLKIFFKAAMDLLNFL
jgi:hypothetical protein